MDTLNNAVIWVGTVVILGTFIMSLIYSNRVKNYMKGFFFCILIGLLISTNTILGILFFSYTDNIRFTVQSILLLLDLVFWSLFFSRILKDAKNKRIIKITFVATFSIAVYILYNNSNNQPNFHVAAILNICKTVYCILFYLNLFKKISDQNILTQPSFWVVSGVIFYSSLSLPFYGLNNYIRLQFSPLISYNIFSISNMLIIIMYLFFIKAYLCKTHPLKVS